MGSPIWRRANPAADEANLYNVFVFRKRTFLLWLHDEKGPPVGAVAELARLSDLEAATRARIVSDASQRLIVRLLRYANASDLEAAEGGAMPLGCHAMMIARAAAELRTAGVAVEVEWAG